MPKKRKYIQIEKKIRKRVKIRPYCSNCDRKVNYKRKKNYPFGRNSKCRTRFWCKECGKELNKTDFKKRGYEN